jgi:parallel beta-helix repeat protein
MKKLLNLLLIAFVLNANATDYYLSPTGNDNTGAGTLASPWFSLKKAWTIIVAGDNVYLRGGTYAFTTQQYLTGKNGTAGNLIKIQAYQNEVPVITKGSGYTHPLEPRGGCYFSGNYVHWYKIRITGFSQEDAAVWSGLWANNVNNCIFEQLEVDNNGGGLYIQNSSTNNLVKNCDFHDNYDPITNGGNADGLDVAYCISGTTNTVVGCRSWNNSDDGYDAFENLGYIYYDSCWSWHNGYIGNSNTTAGDGDGFKLGRSGVGNGSVFLRKITRSLAVLNKNTGYHQEEGDCRMELYNNVAYNNVERGFLFDYVTNNAHIFRNNIAYENGNGGAGINAVLNSSTTQSNNSYGGTGFADTNWTNNVTSGDFTNLITTQLTTTRQTNGTLPDIGLLHLATGSDLIDAGIAIAGLGFNGTSLDRGAFETGGTNNIPPTANAGADQSITLPTSNVTLSGSGTDADGTIASYAWSRISGPNTPTIVSPSSALTNVTGLIAGTYVFRLTVTDNLGATGFDDVTITVSATSVPLTVSITSPANNATVSGTTNISANAADDVPIDRVEFYYDYTTTNTSPTLFTDNFNRANSNTIGTGWTERYTASNYQIVSNKIKLTTNDGNITSVYRLNGLVSADYSVQATLNFSSLSSIFAGVGGRMANYLASDINGYMAFAEPGAQGVYIYKRINGNWTQLGAITTPIAINTDYVLKLAMSGTSLKAYWNGALVISVTDGSYIATGYTGVVSGTGFAGSIGVTWDDFATEPISTSSNTTLIGSDLTSPYSVSWNTLGLPNGNYKLTAKVYNTNAENAVSTPVNVTVSNTTARANAVLSQTEDIPAILNKNGFVLYPNPVGNELNVVLTGNSNTSFTITDVLGRTVKTITVKANTGPVKLDVTGIPAGTYFITGKNKDGLVKTNKFIKQ